MLSMLEVLFVVFKFSPWKNPLVPWEIAGFQPRHLPPSGSLELRLISAAWTHGIPEP
jgi:hypothetical protein